MRDGEHQHRPGVDIASPAPGSVSLAALAGGGERVIDAHDRAVRRAVDRVERTAADHRDYGARRTGVAQGSGMRADVTGTVRGYHEYVLSLPDRPRVRVVYSFDETHVAIRDLEVFGGST